MTIADNCKYNYIKRHGILPAISINIRTLICVTKINNTLC